MRQQRKTIATIERATTISHTNAHARAREYTNQCKTVMRAIG